MHGLCKLRATIDSSFGYCSCNYAYIGIPSITIGMFILLLQNGPIRYSIIL